MVVGVVRAVGPPSTMRGSLSPSCSRTPRGGGAFWMAGEVGRGRGDGQAESADDGAGNGCFRDAQGEVAGVGRDT